MSKYKRVYKNQYKIIKKEYKNIKLCKMYKKCIYKKKVSFLIL